MPEFEMGEQFAHELDRKDPLKNYREKFDHPDPNLIYLDGNSLGRLPLETKDLVNEVTGQQWGNRLIRSWNEGWYDLPARIATKLSGILGAGADEIAVGDSTSVNLYKTAFAAIKYKQPRRKVVTDVLNFPTDIYILQGIIDQLGKEYNLELVQSDDGISVSMEELDRVIDAETAVVVLSAVTFKSAGFYDMEKVTELVHSKGALMIWDLSHAAGAVPVDLNRCGTDMAIGCTYKYLNGGPGSPAYLYVSKPIQDKLSPPVWGWFGDQNPFEFQLDYRPASGIRKFMAGTPPVISLAAIEPGLDLVLLAGMENIRQKSVRQTGYLEYLWEQKLKPVGFALGSPTNPQRRGSHISLRHPEAYRICKALIQPVDGSPVIIPDFREPDNIRLGISPLYNSYREIFDTVERLHQIVFSSLFKDYSKNRKSVT